MCLGLKHIERKNVSRENQNPQENYHWWFDVRKKILYLIFSI